MKNTILFLLLFALAGCTGEADYSAREINWDRDICVNCLMGLAEKEYSAQAINQRSDVIWFDDIGCLVEYMKGEDWQRWKGDGEVKIWVGHCETGEWIDAEKAWYRFGDRTPMGYGYGALKQKAADSYDYKTMIERIDAGYTKREQFLKDKKMLHQDKSL
jgi:nitrous oxide reductase accessory protein NosL